MQNTQIVSFNELERFTSLTELTDGGRNKGFYNCTNLRYIKLPNSLVKMGGGIEYGASIFNNTAIEELVIPEKVKTIGSQNALFSYMPNLRRIEFKCKFINTTYYGVRFRDDAKLEEIILSEGDHIEVWTMEMFRGCTKLDFTNILHPEYVTFWGVNAFLGVTAPNPAKGIPAVFNMPRLTSLSHYPWDNNSTKQVTLLLPQDFMVEHTNNSKARFKAIYVNDDLYDTYLSNTNWAASASILHKISEYVEE